MSRRKDSDRLTSHERGYDARWRSLRAQKLRANSLCEECDRGGILERASMVHHIVPIEDGGEVLDWENLMSLCEACHSRKHSNNPDLGQIKGTNIAGFPTNTKHPWYNK